MQNNLKSAIVLNNQAYLLTSTGEVKKAKALLVQAIKIKKECIATNKFYTLQGLNNLGLILMHNSEFEESSKLFERALKLLSELGYAKTKYSVVIYNNYGLLK